MNRLMRLWCVSPYVLSYRRYRPHAFENGDGGALAASRTRCRLRD